MRSGRLADTQLSQREVAYGQRERWRGRGGKREIKSSSDRLGQPSFGGAKDHKTCSPNSILTQIQSRNGPHIREHPFKIFY